MSTKILRKIRSSGEARPAAVSAKLRRKAVWVIAFFIAFVTAAALMVLFKIWVPGLAWAW